MKNLKSNSIQSVLVVATLLLSSMGSQAQEASVDNSTLGVEVGLNYVFLDLEVHHELKLTNRLVLRSEIGLEKYNGSDNSYFTSLSLAPRFYYSLKKRAARSKNIAHNSGGYVSLKFEGFFGEMTPLFESKKVPVQIYAMTPTLGVRRVVAKKLILEASFGVALLMTNIPTVFLTKLIDEDEKAFYSTITPVLAFSIGYRLF